MDKNSVEYKIAMNMIDDAIELFRKKYTFPQRLIIYTKYPREDYFVTNFRDLAWQENDLNYSIKITPIDYTEENIDNWKVAATVSYSTKHNFFKLEKEICNKALLPEIANKSSELINDAYLFVKSLKKIDIPFAYSVK